MSKLQQIEISMVKIPMSYKVKGLNCKTLKVEGTKME